MKANRVQRGKKESSRLHFIERVASDFRLPKHFQFHIIKMHVVELRVLICIEFGWINRAYEKLVSVVNFMALLGETSSIHHSE